MPCVGFTRIRVGVPKITARVVACLGAPNHTGVVWTSASRGENLCNVDAERSPEDSAPSRRDESSHALVERVVRDIDGRGEAGHDVLLSDLLCAAWPAVPCQLQ